MEEKTNQQKKHGKVTAGKYPQHCTTYEKVLFVPLAAGTTQPPISAALGYLTVIFGDWQQTNEIKLRCTLWVKQKEFIFLEKSS